MSKKNDSDYLFTSRVKDRKVARRFFLSFIVIGLILPVLHWLGNEGYIDFTPPSEEAPQFIAIPHEDYDSAISIVTWNIKWFPGQSTSPTAIEEQEHMVAVRKAIRKIDADIYLLQEMRNLEVVRQLFDPLPEYEVSIVSYFSRGFPMQVAIVSRLQSIAAFAEGFESGDDIRAPPRGFAFAAIPLTDRRTLLAYSVHLKANLGDPATNIRLREESARQILRHAEEMKLQFPDPIVVVGGDFNLLLKQSDMAHEQTLEFFKAAGYHWGWEDVPFRDRVTWPARGRFGDANFDMFLTYGIPADRSKVLHGFDHLSDHRPVRHWVVLER